MKFRVPTSERTLFIANFLLAAENVMKFPLLFKRIIARKCVELSLKFLRDFSMKIRQDKERNSPISFALLLHSTVSIHQ